MLTLSHFRDAENRGSETLSDLSRGTESVHARLLVWVIVHLYFECSLCYAIILPGIPGDRGCSILKFIKSKKSYLRSLKKGYAQFHACERQVKFTPKLYYEKFQIYIKVERNTGLPWWLSNKESFCQCKRHRSIPQDQEEPLDKEMVGHYSMLVWEIPWTEDPGRLQSKELQSQTWLRD